MQTVFCELPYHQQDVENFCGLATAQMLLARLGPNTPDQRFLAGSTAVSNGGISAGALCDILNAKKPADFASDFVTFSDDDRDVGIRRIVDTLVSTRLPVPALIFGSDPHWITVTGAVVEGEAQAGEDHRLRGFFIANSAPVTAVLLKPGAIGKKLFPGRPMPHITGDHCGEGGLRGAKHIYVSALGWRRHHWPDASADLPHPAHVTITNQRAASDQDVAQAPICVATVQAASGAAPGPVDQDSAKAAALAGIKAHGLDRCGPFRNVLTNVSASQADRHDNDAPPKDVWFLVTLQDTIGTPVASAFVAEDNGELLGVIAPQAPTGTPLQWKTITLNALAVESHAFAEFAEFADSTPLVEDDVRIIRPRFWRPCAESMSPYYGFIEARVRDATLYIGYGGRAHRELHRATCAPRPSSTVTAP
jgi:hypothetical protein